MKQSKGWRPQLTAHEKRQGWVFFGLYLFILPIILPGILWVLDEKMGVFFSIAFANVIYYLVILLLLVALFWDFLRHALGTLLDWLPENLFAIATGLALFFLLYIAMGFIPLPVESPLMADYRQQFAISPGSTLAVVVILQPICEEILFRGLLFGSLRKHSRVLAYLVSVVIFALACVWQYAISGGEMIYLLAALRYIPMALALTWCYDNGGSVWSPVLLHMLISGITLALSLR